VSVLGRLFLTVHQSLFSLVTCSSASPPWRCSSAACASRRCGACAQQLGAITVGLVICLVLYAFATTIPTLLGRPLERGMQAALTTAALTLGSARSRTRWSGTSSWTRS
jgi:hypothetical protein